MSNETPIDILEFFKSFDSPEKTEIDEFEISTGLRKLGELSGVVISEQLRAEILGFDFSERDNPLGNGRIHFGPKISGTNQDGSVFEYPTKDLITPEIIAYWESRCVECSNPVLIGKYSGLVLEFKRQVCGEAVPIRTRQLFIESILRQAIGDHNKYKHITISRLKYALALSIAIKDEDLIKKCKDTILIYEEKCSTDLKTGNWGFAFDLLIENKRVNLSDKEEKEVILTLEKRLSKSTRDDSINEKIDPWAAERAAKRLAKYYFRKKKFDEVSRVLLKVGEAFDAVQSDATSMQASYWLEQLHKLYTSFNLIKEADGLLIRIRALEKKSLEELKPFSKTFELSKTESEEYLTQMLEGNSKNVIDRIVNIYIPNRKKVKEQIFDLAKTASTIYLVHHHLYDESGRIVAKIGSLEEDLEGHIVRQISQNMSFSSIFLHLVLERALESKILSPEVLIDHIKESPIIKKDRIPIIERGLEAYWANDYLVMIHLLIPQIEDSIRNLLELAGGNVLKPPKGDGYQLRTLDDLLRDELLIRILGEDLSGYFQILLTDRRGWNLRNRAFHGLSSLSMFNKKAADRVLHAFLCLGVIVKRKETE